MTMISSADGTKIDFDATGDGVPLIIIGGLLCDRGRARPLAGALSRTFRVINFDRRGRGQSGDNASYAVDREIEDIAALIDWIGDKVVLYGHSSGAGLAAAAAAANLPVSLVVLHEPPYGRDDEESRNEARTFARAIEALLDAGRPAEAVASFYTAYGLPPEMVDSLSSDPDILRMAHTMAYDFAVMGETDGGTIPEPMFQRIKAPTLVLTGSESPEFFQAAAERIIQIMPTAVHHRLQDAAHDAPPDVVARAILAFAAAAGVQLEA
jgi:pimeloyl-ACP methyl ester carboxylesterase